VGNLYISGQVADSVWADTARGYRSVGGGSDFFVMKYGVDCNCTSMPVATFDTSRSGTGGATVTFTYSGTTTGIDSMRWYFGDGTTSTSTSPTHTYSTIDTYYACVYIYSACGNDRHCADIALKCLASPTATFTSSGIAATKTFNYTGTTTGIDSIVWDFGDGTPLVSSTNSNHVFENGGTYLITLIATDGCGSCTYYSSLLVGY
jgi:PKD repeat protein